MKTTSGKPLRWIGCWLLLILTGVLLYKKEQPITFETPVPNAVRTRLLLPLARVGQDLIKRRRLFQITYLGPLRGQLTAQLKSATTFPLDWRHRISAADFERTAMWEWTSPLVQTPFPFEELIYSWHLSQAGDTFRLYLKDSFGPADETDWLYACWIQKVLKQIGHVLKFRGL